jgi:thymidylate synthase ThyX
MIKAEVVADSLAPCQKRATTFVLTYPRFIHSEVMTHRQFSRNAASSRAIPASKMIERILQEPALPVHWGKNQKGMRADVELSLDKQEEGRRVWLCAMSDAVRHARQLVELGVHKQIANRVLEPYMHMATIVTATEYENFFALRAHPDAQPEFQELAYLMLQAYLASTPRPLQCNEWHLPFADRYVPDGLPVQELLKITTARCARVSYWNFEGTIDFKDDYSLHDDLLKNGHMSPFEHALRAEETCVSSGNVVGFTQYRKLCDNEVRNLNREEMVALLGQREKA